MEKIEKTNKFKDFCVSKKENLITLGVVVVLFNLMLAINGCFPYGHETIAMGDTLAQIGAFFGHIFNVFEGKSDLFYTNYLAGGIEVFSTIQYMLLNPFYLIAILAGKNNVYLMLNFSVMFMFVFNALVFVWFAKKYFPNVKSYIKVCLAVLFAFSPYIAANICFVTWLIYPGILLILIDKFLNLVNQGKILGFVCTMVWYVCTCFSVGVSTNIILIVLFSAYIFFTKQKEERKPILVRLVVAYVIAILSVVVILFPSLMAFMGTTRTGLNLTNMFNGDYIHQESARLTFVVLPSIFLVFAIYHLVKSDKKEGKNKFYIFSLINSALPLLFGMVTELLTGGQCMGLYFRFGFIFISLLIVVSLEFFNAGYSIEVKKESHMSLYKILSFSIVFFCVAMFVWWAVMCINKFSGGIKGILVLSGFSQITLIMIVSLLLLILFTFFIRKKGLISARLFKGMVSLAVIITVIMNYIVVGLGLGSGYDYNGLKNLTQKLDSNSKVKMTNSILVDRHVNSLDLEIRNSSAFTSLIPEKMTASYESVGYLVSNVSYESGFANFVTDSLTGQKYYVSFNEINMPHLKFIAHDGDYYIYENLLSTTGAVVLDKDFELGEELNPYERLEALKESFGFSENLFEDISLSKESVEFDERFSNYLTKYTYTAEKDGIIYLNKKVLTIDPEDNKEFKEYFDEQVGLENVFLIENAGEYSGTELRFIEKGETIEFYVAGVGRRADKTDEENEFKFINYSVAEAVCKELQARQVEMKYTKNGYELNLNGKTGKLIVFNVDIDGMNYTIDGKKVDAGNEWGYFATFEVDENTKTIVAKYEFPHTLSWVLVTIFAVIVIAVIIFVYKKTKFKFMEKFVYYAFIVANCCILLFFVGFGMFLTIFRIIV